MRGLFCLSILLCSFNAWSCLQPTPGELMTFFEGASLWTEVKDAESFELAVKRPVFLKVPFEHPEKIEVRWGSNLIGGNGLSVCWAQPEKRSIIIQKAFFRTELKKVKTGLLKSWIPVDGDLFYRKDRLVVKPSKLRVPAAPQDEK